MTVVAALTVGFVWMGMTTREFDWQAKRRLLGLIVVVILYDLVKGIL